MATMHATQDGPETSATPGVVISFAPYAAAAWGRADRGAQPDAPREAVIIPFPRLCPALRALPAEQRSAACQPGSMSDPF